MGYEVWDPVAEESMGDNDTPDKPEKVGKEKGRSVSRPSTNADRRTSLRHKQTCKWGILDARNMEKQGYAEFAVLQVCDALVCDDLEGLVHAVGDLVGVVDFSFRVEERHVDGNSDGKGKAD